MYETSSRSNLDACDVGVQSLRETTFAAGRILAVNRSYAGDSIQDATDIAEGSGCFFCSSAMQRGFERTHGIVNATLAPPIAGAACDILSDSFLGGN